MSERRLSFYQSKNGSKRSPNKGTSDESKLFGGVKAGIPIATHMRGARDRLRHPASSIPISDHIIEKNCSKSQKEEKNDRSRIPINNSVLEQHCSYLPPPRQYQVMKFVKSPGKSESKFGFTKSPNKLQSDIIVPSVFVKDVRSGQISSTVEGITKVGGIGNSSELIATESSKKYEVKSDQIRVQIDEKLADSSNDASKTDRALDETFELNEVKNEPSSIFAKEGIYDQFSSTVEGISKYRLVDVSEFNTIQSVKKYEVKSDQADSSNDVSKTVRPLDKTFELNEDKNESPSIFAKDGICDQFSSTVEGISKSQLVDASGFNTIQSSKKDEVKSDHLTNRTDEKLVETSNEASKTDRPLDETFELKEVNEPSSIFAKEGICDKFSITVEGISKYQLVDVSEFNAIQCSKKDEVQSDQLTNRTDEKLVVSSNEASKTDRSLDETYLKSQSLSELIDESSNQTTESESALNQTYVKSRKLSEIIEEAENIMSAQSSVTEASSESLSTDLTGENNGIVQEPGSIAKGESKQTSSSSPKISEEIELPEETSEPAQTIDAVDHTVNSKVKTPTATKLKILKQLENITLKLQQNHERLLKAQQYLIYIMESPEDLSPEDDMFQQVEEFEEETVDIPTDEVLPVIDEAVNIPEGMENVYPVPWAGVKTVSFLFSLIGSNNVVSISPREAATTIHQDRLISHYEHYLKKVQSKKELVKTIQKLMLDGLELVEDRMKAVKDFQETWGELKEDGTSESDYVERRKLLLECSMYLRQTVDDFNMLFSRVDQYVMELAELQNVLRKFLRAQVRLFPDYKNLSSP